VTGHGGLVRVLCTLAALGAAAALTVVLAEDPARSAFTGVTSSSGNSVSAAANFCTSTGTTLTASGDSWIDSSASAANNGGAVSLLVKSSTAANQRAVIRFTLPALPTGCVLSAAEVRMYNISPVSGRTIDVYRGDPAAPLWAEGTVTWANQPPAVGTAVPSTTGSTAGWQTWTVTDHVLDHYAGINNGFIVRDRTESASGTAEQRYSSREGAIPPELVLTWG
jgi:hypothetical protein